MTRRTGLLLLTLGLAVFCCCAGLVGYRLLLRRAPPAPVAVAPEPVAEEPGAAPRGPISTIIDLPGDPVLVRRGASLAPRATSVALPASLAAGAPKIENAAFFVSAPLVSTNGGFMGKFPEAAEGADIADASSLYEGSALTIDPGAASAAGFDDDGGASTPDFVQTPAGIADLSSSQFDASIAGPGAQAQIKEVVIRVVVKEKISELLIRNGFTEDSARSVEAAAKAAYNIQSLPPSSIAIADGALDTSGAYRVTQFAIYENKEYVGAVALSESGGYGEGAQPAIPQGLFDDTPGNVDASVRYNLSDGIYSAGVRNNVPEPVIREAIRLLGRMTDLKAPLPAEGNIRLLYARDFRGKSKLSGKVIYVGLSGPGGAVDCYSFQAPDGGFQCFDAKGGSAAIPVPVPSPVAKAAPAAGGAAAPASPGRVFAPIKGAPVTSLFGMRFHPILHILRLHAGIDFGAPIGSTVRAVADGKVEIAGPVSGFGNHVRLQHKGFETSYSHLSEISAGVAVGATVTQGQTIALSGNTGLSTGPHLHFEYYLDRVAVDPMPHMGAEVPGSGGSGGAVSAAPAAPSDQEVAAFSAARQMVDAALLAASN